MAKGRRRGFLPIETNAFDRVFIAVITGIAVFLAYFRFFETDVSVWVPFGAWLAWLTVVVARG